MSVAIDSGPLEVDVHEPLGPEGADRDSALDDVILTGRTSGDAFPPTRLELFRAQPVGIVTLPCSIREGGQVGRWRLPVDWLTWSRVVHEVAVDLETAD